MWEFGKQRELIFTAQISIGDSKVEGTKTFAGEYSRSVNEISKDIFQTLVNFRPEGKIIDEDDGGGENLVAKLRVKKITFDEWKFGVDFPVKFHPKLEICFHFLEK